MYIYIIYVSEKVTGLSEAILLREAHGTERTKERWDQRIGYHVSWYTGNGRILEHTDPGLCKPGS